MNPARRRLLAAALATPLACRSVAWAAQDEFVRGVFLVANPELRDPNFRETVVLLTQVDAGGAPFGIIINRPLAARLQDALPDVKDIPSASNQIYAGGPLGPSRVLFLLRSAEPPARSAQVVDDVYLTADPQLPGRISKGEVRAAQYRAFIGYAGWARRQLQAEIAAGAWYVLPADAEVVFSAQPAGVWAAMLQRATAQTT